MADVARRVVRMLEGSLGRDDVHIELRTASVQVDAAVATPLAVVLNELIQNAIEHGLGDGPGTVTIDLHGGDDRPVELQVRDNGPGNALKPPPPGPGAPELKPPPPEPGAPELKPPPPGPGAPEREGSPGEQGAQPAVHSPWTTAPTPGGGLGLRLVRGLVEEELGGQFTLTHPAGLGNIATAVIPPAERAG
jgi:two-component sensor histidine kinase